MLETSDIILTFTTHHLSLQVLLKLLIRDCNALIPRSDSLNDTAGHREHVLLLINVSKKLLAKGGHGSDGNELERDLDAYEGMRNALDDL